MWFKVSDSLQQHRKALEAGTEAIGLWVMAGAWSCGQLTDGFVPDYALPRLAANAEALASRLVQVGLWERTDSGYQFHDWENYQPDAATTREREATRSERRREAGRKGGLRSGEARRSRSGRSNAEANGEANAEANGEANREAKPKQTVKQTGSPDPDPEVSPNGDTYVGDHVRPDVDQVCERMLDQLHANGVRAKVTKKWRTEARLLLDRDGRELAEVLSLIDWAANDPFWSANIHSVPTLRKQFDKLRMKRDQPALRAVSGGHQPWTNPDQSDYEDFSALGNVRVSIRENPA